jgi:transposase InsO family protein
MERVAIDILGLLPKTEAGNEYLLVAQDYFTKWPEAFALSNQQTPTVADVQVNQFFSHFGIPLEIHSDQGRNFESALFQEICSILQIEKTRTTPYHPESDGIVERFNQTLEIGLRKFVNKNHSDWDFLWHTVQL